MMLTYKHILHPQSNKVISDKHIFGNYIEEEKTHTTPLRNSSTISFCFFLVWDCNLELFPAMYLDFQLPYFGSNSFNR